MKEPIVLKTYDGQNWATRSGQIGGQQDSLLNKRDWTRGEVNELLKIVDYYLETRHVDNQEKHDTLEE
jgi:hypothetical protein